MAIVVGNCFALCDVARRRRWHSKPLREIIWTHSSPLIATGIGAFTSSALATKTANDLFAKATGAQWITAFYSLTLSTNLLGTSKRVSDCFQLPRHNHLLQCYWLIVFGPLNVVLRLQELRRANFALSLKLSSMQLPCTPALFWRPSFVSPVKIMASMLCWTWYAWFLCGLKCDA